MPTFEDLVSSIPIEDEVQSSKLLLPIPYKWTFNMYEYYLSIILCPLPPFTILKPLYWGMIDTQKAVHIACVQSDEFGDKYTPKKTITATYAVNMLIASWSFPLILTIVLQGWWYHHHFKNREAVLGTWSNIPKLTQWENRVQILTVYHKIASSILSYFHTYPRGTYWILD